ENVRQRRIALERARVRRQGAGGHGVRGQDLRQGHHMNVQNQPKGSRERTLDEVKAEFMRRAGKLNPFEDIKREDAETVMAALRSLDKDHWAEEWSKLGH